MLCINFYLFYSLRIKNICSPQKVALKSLEDSKILEEPIIEKTWEMKLGNEFEGAYKITKW